MTAEFGVGQHIGDYEILSVLGMGGMGKVYKVRNVIADRVEAMKILLPDLSSSSTSPRHSSRRGSARYESSSRAHSRSSSRVG